MFYRQEIELLNKKGSLIKALNKSKELLANYSNNVWSVDETLFNKIKIKPEIITQIKTLLLNQKKEQSQLDDADKVLAQMTKARRGLIKEFYNAAESGKFDKNKCPLCGTNFLDINSAIIETEQFIKNIHTDGIKIIEEIETQIINLFQKEIIPVLKVFLEENKILIKMDDTLSGYKALSVERLQQLLYRVKILEFKSQGIEKFDMYAAIDAKKGEDKQIKEYIDKNILKENDMINVFSVLDMKESFQRYVSKYYMIGSFLVVILAFIGIMNFFNTTATSVISRKKELALLEVVGMTKKQISKMLVAEGFLYLGGAFVIAVLLIVFGAKQILVNTLGTAFFFRLHLTIVPCVLMIPILVRIAYVIPKSQFEKMSRESIVERIRKE